MGYTFVSYSRKQLYFAEAIALHLENYGIQTWFDIQQFKAGIDWASSLRNGLHNCDRLVLVVSKASLASPYVKAEWLTALARHREIILAVVEDVSLPRRLQGFPTFDFRTNFNSRVKQLADYLKGKAAARHDNIPSPGWFPYPLHMPFTIWLTLLVLSLPFLLGFVVSVMSFAEPDTDTFNQALKLAAFFLLGGVLCFVFLVRRFWLHNLSYEMLRYGSLGAFVLQCYLAWLIGTTATMSRLPLFLLNLVLGSMLLNFIYYIFVLSHSGSLLRWFATGQATQKLRRRFHGPLAKLSDQVDFRDITLSQTTPVSFFIHCDPADIPIAKFVSNIFCKIGHTQSENYGIAQRQVMIITNRTPRKLLEWVNQTFRKDVVYLLGSSIDVVPCIAQAGKTQFLDIRAGNRRGLEMLARSFSDLEAWRRDYGLEVAPISFETFDAPAGIQVYRYYGYAQAASFIANVFGLLFIWAPSVSWGFGASVIFMVVATLLMVLLGKIMKRHLTAFLSFLIMPGIPTLIFIMLRQPISILLPVIFSVGAFAFDRYWFPAQSQSAADRIGVDTKGAIRRQGWLIFLIMSPIYILLYKLTVNTLSSSP